MDLHFLKGLLDAPGPYATVLLDVSHDTPDATRAVALRWAGARLELAEFGADDRTLDAMERAVLEAEPAVGRAGQALVARSGTVLLDRRLPAPPAISTVRWSALPDLLPVLLALPEPVTAVAVRADVTGGEILLAEAGADPRLAERVHAGEYPVHKVPAGGWSHLPMQERVEESWRRNTAALAERVDAVVSDTGARVLLLAGDGPARSRLRDALSDRTAAIAVDVEHSGGAADDELAAAVAEAVLDVESADREAVLARYAEASGRPDGRAVAGLEPVLEALRAGRVDVLLLDGAAPPERDVWVCAAPNLVATDPEQLRALGGEPLERAPAGSALVRAAAGSGASFQPLPEEAGRAIRDGVAALLRY